MSEENKKEQLSQAFYAQEAQHVLEEMQTDANGLTNDEAQKRLSEYGPNELEEGKKKSMVQKFFEQFKDLMIIVLLAAAII